MEDQLAVKNETNPKLKTHKENVENKITNLKTCRLSELDYWRSMPYNKNGRNVEYWQNWKKPKIIF